ncbi:MAG: hypothetical protein KDA61_08850 [Planctomycetales bacterium]|nr:hypothetical protein [Planctomycetales bacterium]
MDWVVPEIAGASSSNSGTANPVTVAEVGNMAVAAPSPTKTYKRRSKRSWGGPVLALVVLASFGGIGACLYLLTSGKQLTTDGTIVAANDRQPPGPQVNPQVTPSNQTVPPSERPPRDAIMGSLGRGGGGGGRALDPPPPRNADGDPTGPTNVLPDLDAANGSMMIGGGETPPSTDPSREMADDPAAPEPSVPAVASEPEMPPADEPMEAANSDPEMASGEMEMTESAAGSAMEPAETEASDATTAALRDSQRETVLGPLLTALRAGNYDELPQLIEAAKGQELVKDNQDELTQLALLSELAGHYLEGIRGGSTKLKATETFELTPGITVAVVESSRDSISLRINGQSKRYQILGMPLILAHRLAEFGLPMEDPVARAGRAAFQSLWPDATAGHRQQAFDWWNELAAEREAVDVSQLESTVRRLFEMPPSE